MSNNGRILGPRHVSRTAASASLMSRSRHRTPTLADGPASARRDASSVRVASMDVDEFLDVTSATSLVVVVDGVLIHEWYADGVTAEDRLLGNSATKSALALRHRRRGLGRPAARPRRADPRPRPRARRRAATGTVTVRQLLTMTTGVGWVEDYHDPDSAASRMIGRWREGLGGIRGLIADIPAGDPPGTRYAYCSPDSMVLDWVRERATGQTFAGGPRRRLADHRRRTTRRGRPRRAGRGTAASRWRQPPWP